MRLDVTCMEAVMVSEVIFGAARSVTIAVSSLFMIGNTTAEQENARTEIDKYSAFSINRGHFCLKNE